MAAEKPANERFKSPSPPGTSEVPNAAEQKDFQHAIEVFQKASASENVEQMEAAAMSVFAVRAAAAIRENQEPSPEQKFDRAVRECERRGDWAEAEAGLRKILAREQARGIQMAIFKAHHDLVELYRLLGRFDEAEAEARAAVAAARRADCSPLVARALQTLAHCALLREDATSALDAASQALATGDSAGMSKTQLAGALVTRARCRLAAGDLPGCESDLAATRPLLVEREVSAFLAGLCSSTAGWWEVTARVRAVRDDLPGACEAWGEAVKLRRQVSEVEHAAGPYTLGALARALSNQDEALSRAGRIHEAKTARNQAKLICWDLRLPTNLE